MTAVEQNAQQSESTPRCKACFEPIHARAKVCPHCHSSQLPQKWKNLASSLKWAAGIVTVLSLLGGIITLNRHYQDWQDQRDNINELVVAAEWLINNQNYKQAWEMYRLAAAVSQSSARVRQGQLRLALLWVRDFNIEKQLLDQILTELSHTLYRGLAHTEASQRATILAHIGHIQSLRYINGLTIFTDVHALFERAKQEDPNNVFANAMHGRWLLFNKPVDVARITTANALFDKALQGNSEHRQYLRSLQLSSLTAYTFGYNDEVGHAALKHALQACFTIMLNGEAEPSEYHRQRILDSYGRRGKAERLDKLLSVLPPDKHLRVYEWLWNLTGDARPAMQQQARYIIARLNEEASHYKKALNIYRSLAGKEQQKEIAQRVTEGIARVTGALPAQTLTRNYQYDSITTQYPLDFHLDTLANFDPRQPSENFSQSIAYFRDQLRQNSPELGPLLKQLPDDLNRIKAKVREGDELYMRNLYTSGFGVWEHNNARMRWIELATLYADILFVNREWESALAQIKDVYLAIGGLGSDWRLQQATLAFRLAEVYAHLANQTGSDADKANALKMLATSIENNILDEADFTWDRIKSPPFTVLADKDLYKELIRGR